MWDFYHGNDLIYIFFCKLLMLSECWHRSIYWKSFCFLLGLCFYINIHVQTKEISTKQAVYLAALHANVDLFECYSSSAPYIQHKRLGHFQLYRRISAIIKASYRPVCRCTWPGMFHLGRHSSPGLNSLLNLPYVQLYQSNPSQVQMSG